MAFNPHSEEWIFLRDYLESSLEEVRSELESPRLDHAGSQYLRGQAKVLREILALPNNEEIGPITTQ